MALTEINTARSPIFYIKRTIGILLIIAMSAVFFYSGATKLYTIEAFEWTFVDIGISNYALASVLARLLIGLEFAIGAFLLFHIGLKRVTYPITIALLLVFTIYLIILIATNGNSGDCGCFGEELPMTPLQAIIKNIIMLAVTFILMAIHKIKTRSWQLYVGAFLLMASLVVPFVIYPMSVGSIPPRVDRAIDLNPLYEKDVVPQAELRKGKHIVSFMSLTCPHCRKAAHIFHILKKRYPELPIQFVLTGHKDLEQDFFEETEATNIPYILLKDKEAFKEMAGKSVPAIYWINDGTIEYQGNYLQLDPAVIKDWLKQ